MIDLEKWGLRTSRTPRPQADGRLVYAVGDVHGCYDLMRALLGQIARDSAERALGRRPLLVFCGDYIDRGPRSAEVLETLLWLRSRSFVDLRLLKGNHEQALLDFLDNPGGGQGWLDWGGDETLRSYGVRPPGADASPVELAAARDALLAAMPGSHLRLLRELELMLVVGGYAFVHAGVRPGTPLNRQRPEDLLWIRGAFLDAPGPFEKVIVHGHSWVDEQPRMLGHRIGLDTGAYATGVLTALRIDDDGAEALQAR